MEMYRLNTNHQAAELALLLVEGLPGSVKWSLIMPPPLLLSTHPPTLYTHTHTHTRCPSSSPPFSVYVKVFTKEATDKTRSIMVLTVTLTPLPFMHEDIRQSHRDMLSHVYTHTQTHTYRNKHVVSAAAVQPTPIIPIDGDVCSDICFSQCGPVINGLSGAKFRVCANSHARSLSVVLYICVCALGAVFMCSLCPKSC